MARPDVLRAGAVLLALTATSAAFGWAQPESPGAAERAPQCRSAWLKWTDAGFDGVAVGQVFHGFTLRTTTRCAMRGYPRVTLLGRDRRPLPGRVRRSGREGDRVTAVPGQTVTLMLGYTSPDVSVPPCKTMVHAVRLRAPGTGRSATVSLRDGPMRVCRNGVYIQAFARHPFGT